MKGTEPVIPDTVVLRYFSCPARSMNEITCGLSMSLGKDLVGR